MKAASVSGLVFLGIVLIGLVGYFCVLWGRSEVTQSNGDLHNESESFKHDAYSSRHYFNDGNDDTDHALSRDIIKPPGKPHYPKNMSGRQKTQTESTALGTREEKEVATHKRRLLINLRTVLHSEGGPFVDRVNDYAVSFKGRRLSPPKTAVDAVCKLSDVSATSVGMVQPTEEPFANGAERDLLFSKFNLLGGGSSPGTCVIVSSAGSMLHSGLGEFIDSHDVVLRFNHAPTKGYEKDVGSKTTVRIVNSQVVSRDKYNFLEDPIFQNIEIVVWDPSLYNANLTHWRSNPDHPFFERFFRHRRLYPSTPLHLLRPDSLWRLWDFLQTYSPRRLRYNPPSSGFLGLALLVMRCQIVRMAEFIPSLRETDLCHYYETVRDRSCTYGAWHPLAAEKLMTFSFNVANDTTVFRQGVCEIPGYRSLSC